MKALFENLCPERDSSFGLREFRLKTFPFLWHFHPEAELTLIQGGHGQRFVGDDISPFAAGDVVLLAGNLPHTWSSDPELSRGGQRRCLSLVVQFLPDFLGTSAFAAPELSSIGQLLERAERGLIFTGRSRTRAASMMEAMVHAAPAQRLLRLIEVLLVLAADRSARPLCSAGFRAAPAALQESRIGDVRAFLNREFVRAVRLEEAARVAHLSPQSFGRFFKRSTGKRFTEYLNELRVARACELLMRTDRPIISVADEAGFGNLSNFNRQFLALKRMRPRAFRAAHFVTPDGA